MASAPLWKTWLQNSLKANSRLPNSRYVQVATVRPDGRPSNRTVTFRGFVGDTNNLTICSDIRTEKVEEVRLSKFTEWCWYFPQTREQYRLEGSLKIISAESEEDEQQIRKDVWKRMSDKSRAMFAWAPPGQRLNTGVSIDEKSPVIEIDEANPLDTFCVLVLAPTSVDYLDLRKMRRSSHRLEEGEWIVIDVNP